MSVKVGMRVEAGTEGELRAGVVRVREGGNVRVRVKDGNAHREA